MASATADRSSGLPSSAAAPIAGRLVGALLRARVAAVVEPAEGERPQGEYQESGEEAPRVDRGQKNPHDDEQADGAEDEETGDLHPELEAEGGFVHRSPDPFPARSRARSIR